MAKFCAKCGKDLSTTDGVCPDCQGEFKFSKNGVIDRKALKEAAKAKLSNNMLNIWKPLFIMFGLTLVFGISSALIMDENNLFSSVVNLLFSFVTMPLSCGLVFYMLKLVRDEEFKITDLFEFYDSRILTIFVMTFLVGIFTFLWSLLFIIPGIIAAVSYSMCTFIYVDGTRENPLDVIKESKRLTNGYKWDLVVFNLSFLGWILLGMITFGLAYIYVLPYMSVAEVMYYDELKKIKTE